MKTLFGMTLLALLFGQYLKAQQTSDRCLVDVAAHGAEDAMAIEKLMTETTPPSH
jgi:hypothetical protein